MLDAGELGESVSAFLFCWVAAAVELPTLLATVVDVKVAAIADVVVLEAAAVAPPSHGADAGHLRKPQTARSDFANEPLQPTER